MICLKPWQDNNQNLLAITNDFKSLSHNILQGKGTVGALLADSTMAIQLRGAMRNLAGHHPKRGFNGCTA